MFAALASVLAVAGLASAQSPSPNPLPLPPSPAQIAGTPVIGAPVILTGATHVKGSGGCSSCGSAATAAPLGCYGTPACNNGCGSVKSDCGFIFGSCKSFFSPCGPSTSGHGHGNGVGGGCGGLGGGGHHGRCALLPLGTPYGHGYNPCVYDSVLNH